MTATNSAASNGGTDNYLPEGRWKFTEVVATVFPDMIQRLTYHRR